MKKFGKMSLIFELSISKLGYIAIFMKICFRTFLTNQSKNKNEDEKYRKMNSIFEFSISKLGYAVVFIKMSEENF